MSAPEQVSAGHYFADAPAYIGLADAPAYIGPKIAVDRTRLAVDPADRALLPAPEALSPAHSHHSNDGHSKIGALGIGHGPHFRQKQDGVKIPHAIKLRQGPECSDLNGRSEDRLEAQ